MREAWTAESDSVGANETWLEFRPGVSTADIALTEAGRASPSPEWDQTTLRVALHLVPKLRRGGAGLDLDLDLDSTSDAATATSPSDSVARSSSRVVRLEEMSSAGVGDDERHTSASAEAGQG
ncbi:hypothetical protein JCM8115_006209 [Rhodotorula mucilaginosa]|jgi:hypothetical protein